MSTNYIDQITDTAGTTHDISEGDSTRIFRATCSTAAGTAAKVATLQTSSRNFSLTTGVRVAVTFTYGNSAATPTLRVDGSSTGTAKTIATPTAAATLTTGNGTTYNTWGPYETVIFTYNGTYWVKSGSSLGAYTGQPISIATSTGTNQITLNHGAKYSLNVGGNSYIFTTPTDNNSGGTITEVKTSEGAHTTIDVTSGKAEFNVPTKTSHLTNDSGFITSDTKNTTGSSSKTETKMYLIGATSQDTYVTTYSNANCYIDASNNLYSNGNIVVTPAYLTDNEYAQLDNIPTITLNGSTTTSPSFYAPIGAGTDGYVLKSNGSGAPTWTSATLTDTKVTEAYSTSNSSYPLLMTATAGISSTSSRGATTSILNNQIYANPSTGTITATAFNGAAMATTAYDTANLKNIVESTSDPDTASSYPTGTIWIKYTT